jgi:uncharacterized protein YdhG (YjbR/CyaY superfamily)
MVMKKAVTTIDQYLRPLPVREKAALQKLRKAIHAAAPGVEECIRYGVPAFRLDGKLLVAFGVARNHCSLYPGAYPVRALGEELEGYDTSKGTVRFPAERPLPAALVKKLVRARLSQRGARRKR